jgi:chromosome partitioning protein
MRRIAFMNQKGGVGKTTTVANLGAAFAEHGFRVLVVDNDPQANLTTHLDPRVDEPEPTIYEVLTNRATATEAIYETSQPGLFLLPSSIDLSGAEIELVQEMGRETLLRRAIDEHLAGLPEEEQYDFILIDCPPSLGLLSLNALTTVTEVMIPIQTQFFAMRGMSKLLEVVELVKRRLNPALRLSAIIPSIADLRTRLTAEVMGEIKTYFSEKVTRTMVRVNVRLAEAPSHGKSILQYDKSSNGAKDYRRLARELLGLLTPEDLEDLLWFEAKLCGEPVEFDDLPPAVAPTDPVAPVIPNIPDPQPDDPAGGTV